MKRADYWILVRAFGALNVQKSGRAAIDRIVADRAAATGVGSSAMADDLFVAGVVFKDRVLWRGVEPNTARGQILQVSATFFQRVAKVTRRRGCRCEIVATPTVWPVLLCGFAATNDLSRQKKLVPLLIRIRLASNPPSKAGNQGQKLAALHGFRDMRLIAGQKNASPILDAGVCG